MGRRLRGGCVERPLLWLGSLPGLEEAKAPVIERYAGLHTEMTRWRRRLHARPKDTGFKDDSTAEFEADVVLRHGLARQVEAGKRVDRQVSRGLSAALRCRKEDISHHALPTSTQGIRFAFSVSQRAARLLWRLPRGASRCIVCTNRAEHEAGNCVPGGHNDMLCRSQQPRCGNGRNSLAIATERRNRVPGDGGFVALPAGTLAVAIPWFDAAFRPPGSRERGLSRRAAAVDGGVANTI